MEEIWKDINDYEGIYIISNYGNIKRNNRKISCGYKTEKGYYRAKLYYNKCHKSEYMHRLVAKAFINNEFNKPDVNHIDNNPLNNHVLNLEWCTHKENMAHAAKQGRMNAGTIVLNVLTGIYYKSITEAANSINMKANTLVYKLLGKRKNDTNFIYV
jgi:hypothetical protein